MGDDSGDFSMPEDAGYAGDDVVAAPQGFGARFADSFGAILVGIVLIPLACAGLFWNEGHAVHVARALTEAQGIVRSVPADRRDPSLDGRLIHVAGPATSVGGVADEALGVRAPGLVLARRVEMYQWTETESGKGSERRFTYSRAWSEFPVSSGGFHASGHENPAFPAIRSRGFGAADARIDAVPVGATAVQRLAADAETTPDASGLAAARRTLGRPVQVSGGAYYVGQNPDVPHVGDLRIGYRRVPEGPASFLGRQEATGLEPYRASNGEEVLLAAFGTRSAADLVAKGQDDNRILAWILRAVGMVFLLVGFVLLFAPVNLLASYVPILGSLVGGATFVMALAATLLVGPAVMAVAWLAYRPLLAGGIVAGAALAAYAVSRLRGRRLAARPGFAPA